MLEDGPGPYSINCSGSELPGGPYGPGYLWDPKDFANLTDLCDHKGNQGQNMGGMCRTDTLLSAKRPIMTFDRQVPRKIQLWSMFLETYCRENCRCDEDLQDKSTISDVELWNSLRKKMQEYDMFNPFLSVPDWPPVEPLQASDYPYYSDWGYHCQSDCKKFKCRQQTQQSPPMGRPRKHCICALKTKGSRLWAQGSCAAQASRRMPFGGKRAVEAEEDIQVCACNATYVSKACCGVEEGLVWEGPEAWLGEIVLEEHALLA